MSESAPTGEQPLLRRDDATRGSISDVFTRFSSGAPVPAALASAEAERPALVAVPPPPAEAKAKEPDFTISPIPRLTSTQQWFKSSFCAPTLSYHYCRSLIIEPEVCA